MAKSSGRLTKERLLSAVFLIWDLFIGGLVFSDLAVSEIREWILATRLKNEGRAVRGVITDKISKPVDTGTRGAAHIDKVHYTYSAESGSRFSGVMQIESEALFDRYQEGEDIDVLVDPDDPSVSVPKVALQESRIVKMVCLGVLAVIIDFIALLVLVTTLLYFAGWIESDRIKTFGAGLRWSK